MVQYSPSKEVRGITVPLPNTPFDVPAHMEELANDVVARAGDTMSGSLIIHNGAATQWRASGGRFYAAFSDRGAGDAWTLADLDGAGNFQQGLINARREAVAIGVPLALPTLAPGSGALNPKFLNISTPDGAVHGMLLTDLRTILGLGSSRRLKTSIEKAAAHPDTSALTPATFRWNDDVVALTGNTRPQYGLIAEDVAEVDPRLATYDAETGQPDGLNTGALIAALIHKCRQLEARIQQLEGA